MPCHVSWGVYCFVCLFVFAFLYTHNAQSPDEYLAPESFHSSAQASLETINAGDKGDTVVLGSTAVSGAWSRKPGTAYVDRELSSGPPPSRAAEYVMVWWQARQTRVNSRH